jgi:nucleoside-diphosphate-sugar epimerase
LTFGRGRVLVTGHRGYIGSVVSSELATRGYDVVGADVCFYDGCEFGVDPPGPGSELRVDIRDVRPSDLAGFDAVVHLAALSNDPIGELDERLTDDINYRGTIRLGRAAREVGVERFVFASSCSMYGAGGDETPVTEQAPLLPLSAYARSKVKSEEGLAELADVDFAPVFMRNATACGVSPRLRLDVVLNNLAAWAHTTRKVRILSDGTPWRPLVHVRDIARATAAILDAPRDVIRAQAFNIGSDSENYRVSEIAAVVAAGAGDCEVEYVGSGDPDPRSYRVDFGKFARAFPGFEFQWTAERAARELIDAFDANGFDQAAFESDRFMRLRRIRTLREIGALDDRLRWTAQPVEA